MCEEALIGRQRYGCSLALTLLVVDSRMRPGRRRLFFSPFDDLRMPEQGRKVRANRTSGMGGKWRDRQGCRETLFFSLCYNTSPVWMEVHDKMYLRTGGYAIIDQLLVSRVWHTGKGPSRS
jgi:hypothetical protein